FLLPRGQSAGTLGARLVAGTVTDSVIINDDGSLAPLDTASATALTEVPADEHPHTRTIGDNGEFRLIANRMPDGAVLITGLPLHPVQATLYQLVAVGAAVAGVGLLLAGFAGTVVVRLTLRPLRRMAATARRVTQLPLDRGEVALAERVPAADTDPRTEVGQVGAALNSMLGHVGAALAARQASEMKVRQFVADASHELRTPLAAIRGYAELTRRDRDQLPPDVAHALRRVESEATRMTSLVEDLLLLARLDAGRPLEAAPVDLSRLVVDTVSDAHAAGPEHRWQLDLPDEPVIVTGDPARLHQVLANLLANARTHTPPGT
ncbi:HAMP domain-containing sensor histidine kinase, partial [Frankia sp. CiP3]|uniref:HAMP domain-containing sensor histidine kinase n=1 Tax=Frankia sp. CiP3 TaxID=2880971 RepID=UPI001EF4B031